MNRVIEIGHHKNLTINKKITEYIKPQIIYIPLESKNGVEYSHNVKEGDYIYKGEVVAVNKDINFPIHSSVSGYVVAGSHKIINNGRIIMVREALEEVKAEAEQMITNISTLLEELEKVKTKEDAKRFDILVDELTSCYKYLKIF